MSTSGEINLDAFKAKYDIEDIFLVDSRNLEAANDVRLYFEISFGIGLAFLGALISEPSILLGVVTLAFMVFGGFFFHQYRKKAKKLKPPQEGLHLENLLKPQERSQADVVLEALEMARKRARKPRTVAQRRLKERGERA